MFTTHLLSYTTDIYFINSKNFTSEFSTTFAKPFNPSISEAHENESKTEIFIKSLMLILDSYKVRSSKLAPLKTNIFEFAKDCKLFICFV